MNRKLKVLYDPEADALLIKTREKKPTYGEELTDQVIIHFDDQGKPIQIEILYAENFLIKLSKNNKSQKDKQNTPRARLSPAPINTARPKHS
jgi:uncharacterized protein YuzE